MDISREDIDIRCDQILDDDILKLDEESIPWILKNFDCFVSKSRGNESVEIVTLNQDLLHDDDRYNWDWGKVGQVIGSLQALDELHITPEFTIDDNEDEVVLIPDWGILARILSHVRQRMTLDITPLRNPGFSVACRRVSVVRSSDSWTPYDYVF